jgi:hypothetical protein
VGIYAGGWRLIHAPDKDQRVRIGACSTDAPIRIESSIRSLINDHTTRPPQRGRRRPIRVRTDRDQTDTMQHADRVVPAQTNHVRHCHLPGNRDRACSHEPARAEWLPTSGQRPVVSRALHQRCHVRRDRIERTAHRALYRAHRRTIMTPQDRTLCRSQLSGWLSSAGPYR